MTLQDYVENIKLQLTGGLLELEIPDETLGKVVMKSLKEINRYIDSTTFITIPFANVIDLNGFDKFKCADVVNVYRSQAFNSADQNALSDPMYAQQWMIYSTSGSMYNLQNYILNYAAYNTMSQIRNTTSTDLIYKIDKLNNKIYINTAYNNPLSITIEYVPLLTDVEQVTSTYWIDILERLSVAHTKVILGRIRSKFKQSNALWTLDGDQLLEEGNTELTNLRTTLEANSSVFFPTD